MNIEKSLDEKATRMTGLIRELSQMYLNAWKENRVGAWGLLEKVGLAGSDLREMDRVILGKLSENLEDYLTPLGEPAPRTKEEVQTLLEKLDTVEFQDKLRASLSNGS